MPIYCFIYCFNRFLLIFSIEKLFFCFCIVIEAAQCVIGDCHFHHLNNNAKYCLLICISLYFCLFIKSTHTVSNITDYLTAYLMNGLRCGYYYFCSNPKPTPIWLIDWLTRPHWSMGFTGFQALKECVNDNLEDWVFWRLVENQEKNTLIETDVSFTCHSVIFFSFLPFFLLKSLIW